MTTSSLPTVRQPDTLADVLERVLDKGVVIAGDIVVNVLDIELLSLKLRLFIASAQTAQELGMDWWRHDPFFSGQQQQQIPPALEQRLAAIERAVTGERSIELDEQREGEET